MAEKHAWDTLKPEKVKQNVSSMYTRTCHTVWPDLETFRPLGDCLLCAVFLEITKVARIFGLHFYIVKVVH
jgi:hypothetical protein